MEELERFLPPSERRVYPIPELHPLVLSPPSLPSYSTLLESTSSSSPPILCIDNGATSLRAGFSTSPNPYLELDNIGAKYKDRKLNTTVNLAGGEVYVDAASRSSTRVPFEGDVVCNFDVMVSNLPSSLTLFLANILHLLYSMVLRFIQENILDFVLIKLGVDTPNVQTPIVMTETLCNPSYSRGRKFSLSLSLFPLPYSSPHANSLTV